MPSQLIDEINRTNRLWGAELSPPLVFETEEEAIESPLGDELAGFDMGSHNLMINKKKIERNFGKEFLEVILSHEVGHYALAPYDLENMIYLLHAANSVLGDLDSAKYAENLFTDTIVNSYIYKNDPRNKQAIVKFYQRMGRTSEKTPELWQAYLRSYEKLWGLNSGTIVRGVSKKAETAASSIAKMMAPGSISDIFNQPEWQDKMKKYAETVKDLIKEEKDQLEKKKQQDANCSNSNAPNKSSGQPSPANTSQGSGNAGKELGSGVIIHKHDPKAYKQDDKTFGKVAEKIGKDDAIAIYAGLGLGSPRTLEDSLINSLAELHTIRFPKSYCSKTGKKFNGYTKVSASNLVRADIPYSVLTGGRIIPGHNTFAKRFKEASFSYGLGKRVPDLVLALDTSGSMQGEAYYSVLAAKIAANSTLEAGGAVAVSNFSCTSIGHEQGFLRDKKKIYKLIELQQGGGTTFPTSELVQLITGHKEPQYLVVVTDTGFYNVQEAIHSLETIDKKLVGGAFLLVNTTTPIHSELNKFNYDIVPVSGSSLPKEIQLKMKRVLNYA